MVDTSASEPHLMANPRVDALAAKLGSGSLAALLAWRAAEAPEHRFLYIEDDASWSFGELSSAAAELARALSAFGVSRGDKVLSRIGNDERFLPALVATWSLGAAVIVMHPGVPQYDSRRVAESMDARAAIVDPAEVAELSRLGVAAVPFHRLSHDRPAMAGELMVPDVSDDEPALVLLTSGSTGAPKGVVLTHDNAWANLRATVSAFRSDTKPTPLPTVAKPPNLIANPLSHTAGVVRLLFALYVGRDVVLLRKFGGALAKRMVDHYGINNLTLNPAMLRMLLDEVPSGEKLGGVRYASSGTAPLTPALREEFESRFGIPVLQAYGQTEAFGGIAIENVRDVLAGNRRIGSVGKALPGVEIRIVDDQETEVATGSDGEIWVRSRSATVGYLGADESTPLRADGWLRTGDRGHLDPEGYLYITGRIKNIIICGGFNIVPEEVEAALEDDPRVVEAVVIARPDERLGEVPVAVVESTATSEELLESARARLVAYKRPRALFTVSALPRVPNGKIDRAAVVRLASELDGRCG
jgi:acyl-CoA synthetase (AMP-forming)/AMP-acid ligase II